jgi:hypothetical protein
MQNHPAPHTKLSPALSDTSTEPDRTTKPTGVQ